MTPAERHALSILRHMIIDGQLQKGERVSEVSAARILGLSRTPVRAVLRLLAHEGAIFKREGRGYTVVGYPDEDIEKAYLLRGAVEGYAAGRLAEKGICESCKSVLMESLAISSAIADRHDVVDKDVQNYRKANTLFHNTIIKYSDNHYIQKTLSGLTTFHELEEVPRAEGKHALEQAKKFMMIGHMQHRIILEAVVNQDHMRAEQIMREHAQSGLRYRHMFHDGSQKEEQFFVSQDDF